ncbi:hypothetical protein SDC9_178383 [bioreactor metagenome]|uniref:Uncharacterized protein n=1 Tax=bioreactor metagenome TaxID=1076179 RepID=A0A645GXY3_9ZZZZ
MASEPLPEIGRSKASGTISGGKPKNFATGATNNVSISISPDARSMATAVIKAINGGKTLTQVRRPSPAPAVNSSNNDTLRIKPTVKTSITKTGTAHIARILAAFMLSPSC